jgi:hypothetical protein
MVTNHPAAPWTGGQHERWGSHVPDILHQAITLTLRVATEKRTNGSYGTAFSISSVNSNPRKNLLYSKQEFSNNHVGPGTIVR